MKKLFATLLIFASFSLIAQKSRPIELSLSGGVKRTIFETVKKDITAFNITQGYDEQLVTPAVKNSQSFMAALTSSKKLNNRFSFISTAGLDMQQLNIESGFKKQAGGAGITGFKKEYFSTLLPRLKLNFGFKYAVSQTEKKSFDVGLFGGEFIKLSNEGYSYSFVETNIAINSKNIMWFASVSITPYNISIPNFQNYFGNLNADVTGSFEYRIYDVGVGAAIKL